MHRLLESQSKVKANLRIELNWSFFDGYQIIIFSVRYGTLDVEDDRIGECAFDLSAYHL